MDIATAAKAGKITIPPLLLEADELRSQGKPDEALRLCNEFLNNNYGHVPALTLAAHILIDSERLGLAHALMFAANKLAPDEGVILNNLGICYEKGQNLDEAERYFTKALARNPNDSLTLTNLGFIYLQKSMPDKAMNCSEKAMRLAPKVPHARFNYGQAQLMKGEFAEGWKNYEANLGRHQGRKERVYGTIPRWTGENNLTLIAYGEQGIGDEISFASCIPDLQKENTVIIECDQRLTGLFKRSFDCDVYGTRYKKERIEWPLKHPVDATVAMGSLPGFYRPDVASFPGTPYLKPDPERCLQWKALLDSLGPQMKVGITWTGGMKRTLAHMRSMPLKDLSPIWRQDATFISLQYKDAADEIEMVENDTGIKVHHWPHATQTQDMDDQAALMSQLDLVITVDQTAVHLGGALGVPTWVLVPKWHNWRYGLTGDTMPWYRSVKLYRQKDKWLHTIDEIAYDLKKLIASKS